MKLIYHPNILRLIWTVCLLVLFDLVSALAVAGELTARDAQTLTFYFENDTFFGTDYLYTNGVRLSWTSSDLEDCRGTSTLGSWAYSLIGWLPFTKDPRFRRSVSLSIGQNMYTPEDTASKKLIKDDRPYAGVTYLDMQFSGKDLRQMNTWEIMLGVAGQHSYAEDVQKTIHRWKGDDIPQGWDHQIGDEPVLDLFFEHRRKMLESQLGNGWGYDLIPNLGAGLGNLYIGAHVGAQIRFGWNLPNDFGTSLIRPGSDTNAPMDEQDPRFFPPFHRWGVHVFMGMDGQCILRNMTLDGNTFRDSHSVDREPLVGTLMAGVGFIIYRFKITFMQVYQTRAFKTQKSHERYGSITVSYTF
jgi:lipid A 3-O-deacylase